MDFLKVIEKRRSIRAYMDKMPSDEDVLSIIQCGHRAPTGGNIQPWEFIIIKDQEVKRAVVDTTYVGNDYDGLRHQEWIMQAPVIIAVLANKSKSYARYGEKALESLIYLDCSACIENMLLAAVNLGLGSCYISGFREDELAKALKLPENYKRIAFLPLGYQKGDAVINPKADISNIIHYDFFQE